MACNKQDGLLVDNATSVMICADEHYHTKLNTMFFIEVLVFLHY